MSNSTLINYTILSPNHSGQRTKKITRITPHCVVGQLSAESVALSFQNPMRMASSNYIIGTDGDIALCVDENNRSWCSSSSENDQRAVTIECASDAKEPYTMNGKVYNKLIQLCADICLRNNIHKLVWIPNKIKALNYAPKDGEAIITVHRWFANKSCPGDWLYNRLEDLAAKVNKILVKSSNILYHVQCGAFTSSRNASKMVNALKKDGFDCYVVEDKVYLVQCGVFCKQKNAIALRDKLVEYGYTPIIKEIANGDG